MLDPFKLPEELEAELVALVVGQPAGRLGKHDLVVAVGALVLHRLGGHGAGGGEDRERILAHFGGIGFVADRLRAVAEVEAELSRTVSHIRTFSDPRRRCCAEADRHVVEQMPASNPRLAPCSAGCQNVAVKPAAG